MFEIIVEAGFSATHRVTLPDGTLEPLHGHDWRVAVPLRSLELNSFGMVADFVEVQEKLNQIVGELNYCHLNGHEWLAGTDPTAERLARVVFEHMAAEPKWGGGVDRVSITEAPGCTAAYSRS